MLDIVRTLLEASPLLALFLAIATGYAIGQISIAGVSFGAGAVLFTGLIIGAIAPKAAPPGMVGTLGLVMFVYGVGIQYGPVFFASLKGPGLKYIALAAVAVVASLLVAMLLASPLGISMATAAGLFAGSGTSTPTLQAALAAAGNQDPAIGYSVSYPFGVVGPIVLMTLMAGLVKPVFKAPSQNVRIAELTLESNCEDQTVEEVSAILPADIKIVAIRQHHANAPPLAGTRLHEGDGLLLVGSPTSIEQAKIAVGHEEPGRISRDRANYDVVRVYVSKAAFVGKTVQEIPLPDFPIVISHIRRGDVDMMTSPDLTLEYGDVLIAAVPSDRKTEVQRHFGDSIKGNAELSFVSIGVGIALGLLLGMIPVPLPGGGTFSLGVAGGPLVMALVLGWLGRTGPLGWRIPMVANLVLRNLGLAVFIGSVAIGAGSPFVQTVATNGIQILLGGAAVLLTLVLIVLVVGYLLRIPFDDLLGVCAGSTGNPAIVVAAGRLAPTERTDIGYAICFPSMTIVKIIAVQVLLS
ncbi:aspartate:alanine exchanger family transporter [Microvirga lotononidis]|uniref:Putative permease n=1 Tax=Microvirga lotononidis TaxID=864069 RepID=I4YSR4_9HYPH|nr:TrkA C-terminal domain-containing protein [Microvirga lotononidis]EIM27006.1 putative permease [Microvirga lotononidis]WQO28802.1 TrkA C-terminal domain-containing protein [Microvirga lotononidis]